MDRMVGDRITEDKRVEDRMVRQIEKNLHSNMNENLFMTGRGDAGRNDRTKDKRGDGGRENILSASSDAEAESPLVSLDYYNPAIPVSRAEYIRQARESCLRQLSVMQSTARAYDSYYLDSALENAELEHGRKGKPLRLFHEENYTAEEEDSLREAAAFRFLVIRTVCALVLFLSIFLIDKLNINIGSLTPSVIQEYVTGKDTLKELENIVVTLLKD
ncbi:hypothetical protein HNQ56_002683 [Anaerotaenia torta]|uniref:hypothetical protein n=1 Tax=Anaerotaenia torta TaxID=433293 RepID=UPI003D1F1213